MVARMCGSVLSTNVSAQSPPCSRNAFPSATSASRTWSRSTSGGQHDGRDALQHGAHVGDLRGVGPVGLLCGRAGERLVEPGAEVAGQRGQFGQHVDRCVDGPVSYRCSSTGGAAEIGAVVVVAWSRAEGSPAQRRLDHVPPLAVEAGVGQCVVRIGRRRRQGGPARVLPALAQLAGEPRQGARQRRHRTPELAESDVVVGGDPGPQLDVARAGASGTPGDRRAGAAGTATPCLRVRAAWAARWPGPRPPRGCRRTRWTPRRTPARPRPRRRSRRGRSSFRPR